MRGKTEPGWHKLALPFTSRDFKLETLYLQLL